MTSDTSTVITQSPSKASEEDSIGNESNGAQRKATAKVGSLLEASKQIESKNSNGNSRPRQHRLQVQIKYTAKQVISRGDDFSRDSVMPTGTNLIGKLIQNLGVLGNVLVKSCATSLNKSNSESGLICSKTTISDFFPLFSSMY